MPSFRLGQKIPELQLQRFSRQIADAREEGKSFAKIALAMEPTGSKGATYEYPTMDTCLLTLSSRFRFILRKLGS
jgi:hypothetical protein